MEGAFITTVTTWLLIGICAALAIFQRNLGRLIKGLWEGYVLQSVPRDDYPELPLPPGSMGYPVIGETLAFLSQGSNFYAKRFQKYGNIYRTHLLGRPTIRVIGAENVKKILLGENTLVTHYWPTSTRLLLGTGSISQSSGLMHKVRRKHLMHALNMDTLDSYVPLIQEQARGSILEWCRKGDFVAYPECKRMAFSVAATVLIGMDLNQSQAGQLATVFTSLTNNLMTIPLDIPGFGFRKGLNAKKRLVRDLKGIMGIVRNGSFPSVMSAFYDACLELGTDSDTEMYEGVIDLLFAGHETISSAMTNTIMLLGKHDAVVRRLRRELEEFGLLDDDVSADLSYQLIGKLQYVNHVVKEVLRVCPPVGAGFRKVLKPFELGGYHIPKDWMVAYSIRETQHSTPLFAHTADFDPDRWDACVSSDVGKAEKFHYIPFGGGARICPGRSYALLVLKIFVIELVKQCDWDLKNRNPEMRYIPVTVATDLLPVTFRRRPMTAAV